jgi:hypothetical protein
MYLKLESFSLHKYLLRLCYGAGIVGDSLNSTHCFYRALILRGQSDK